ncbi:hypothetical protein, partial [Saccharopolyspora kobensis]
MTDPIGEPKPIKGDDHSRATFDQILFTVTGEGSNLHGVLDSGATPNTGWFVESSTKPGSEQTDGQTAATGYSYHAWDKWYISVDRNATLPGNWTTAVSEIDELVDGLNSGVLGLLNVNRLWEAKNAVDHYVKWLDTNRDTLQQWVTKLTSDDSAFKGKAAYALKQNLTTLVETVESLHEQIAEERNTSEGLRKAAEAVKTFGQGMANVWTKYSNAVRNEVDSAMNSVLWNVATYIRGKGLVHGTENYALDELAIDDRSTAEAYITRVMNAYNSNANTGPAVTRTSVTPGMIGFSINHGGVNEDAVTFTPYKLPDGFPTISGPLGSQATWNDINTKISDHVRKKMEPLDEEARKQLEALQTAYERTKSSLEGLETPVPTTGGGAGGGNTPPPGGGFNFPPPPGGGDNVPPPGGGDNV